MRLVLAIDTSGKNGSLALAAIEPDKDEIAVLDVVLLSGGTFSAQLVPQIDALLTKHQHTKRDLGGFAVVSGPGSFTGLRVGLAAIKALAEVLQQPIAAVSLLEAVASRSRVSGKVLSLLDAGRGDVYVGDYELKPEPLMRSERLLTREELIAEASHSKSARSVVTPDAALSEIISAAAIQVELVEYPDAGVIARLGWKHLRRGDAVSPEWLEANYIRRSDAEIFSKPQ